MKYERLPDSVMSVHRHQSAWPRVHHWSRLRVEFPQLVPTLTHEYSIAFPDRTIRALKVPPPIFVPPSPPKKEDGPGTKFLLISVAYRETVVGGIRTWDGKMNSISVFKKKYIYISVKLTIAHKCHGKSRHFCGSLVHSVCVLLRNGENGSISAELFEVKRNVVCLCRLLLLFQMDFSSLSHHAKALTYIWWEIEQLHWHLAPLSAICKFFWNRTWENYAFTKAFVADLSESRTRGVNFSWKARPQVGSRELRLL